MIVDCGDCTARDVACGDCVVTVLLGAPGMPGRTATADRRDRPVTRFDQAELGALDVLAEVGMVPRLRLVTDDAEGAAAVSLPRRDSREDRHAM